MRKDRADGYGGVLLAVKNDIDFCEIETADTDSVFIKTKLENNNIVIIGSIYRPPSSDIKYTENMCKQIEGIVNSNKNAAILIGGDLNLPDVDWNSNSINGNQYLKAINQCTIDMVNECHLKQIVNEPTRGDNILDVFMTNRPSLVNKCATIPGVGDHDAVHIQTDTRAKRVKPIRRKIVLWNKTDTDSLKNAASEINDKFLRKFNTQNPIDSMWK